MDICFFFCSLLCNPYILFSRRKDIKRLIYIYNRKLKALNDCGYVKININMATHLQVLPQNIRLLWQLINHKHIAYIPELLKCYTIFIVNFD